MDLRKIYNSTLNLLFKMKLSKYVVTLLIAIILILSLFTYNHYFKFNLNYKKCRVIYSNGESENRKILIKKYNNLKEEPFFKGKYQLYLTTKSGRKLFFVREVMIKNNN